ncbi:NLRP12, partial [Branchiostoma lanceolatum]
GKEGDDWYEIKPREEGDEPKDGVLDSAEEKIPLTDADGHKIPDGDADGPIGEPPDGDAKKPTEGDAGFPSNGKIPKQTTGSQTDLTLPTSDDADTEEDRPLLQAAGDRRPKRPKQSDETQTDFDDLDPNLSPSPLKDFKFVDDYSPKDESGLPGSRPDEPRPQSSDFYRVREGPAKYRPASYLIAVGAKDEDAVGPKEGQQPDQGDAVDGRVPSDDAGNGQTSPTRMGGAVPSVQSDDSGVQLDNAGNLHPPGSTLRTITRETYEYRVSGVKRAAWFKGEAAPENGQGEAGKPPIDESGEGVGDTSGDESRPSLQKQTDGTQTDFDAVEPVSLSDESLLKSHDKVPSDPDKVHQYQGLAQKLTRAYLESEGRQQNDDTQGLSTSDESWYTPETEFYPSSGGEQGLPFYDASYTSPAKQSATPKRSPSSGEASLLEDDVSGGGKSLPEKGRSGMGKRKGQQADQVPSDGTSEPTGRHIPRDKLPAQKSSGGSQTDLNELELSRVAWGMQVDDDNRRDAKSDDDKETTATSGRGRPGVNENEQNKGQGRPNTNEDEQKKGQSRPGVNEDEQKKGQSRPGANEDEQKKGKADQYGKVKIDTSMKREYPDQDDIGGTEEPRPGEQITDEIYHPDVHEKGAPGKDDVEDGSRPTATKTGRGQRGDLDEYGKPLAGSGVRLVKQTTTVTVERKVQPSMLTQSSAQTDFDDKALEGYLGLRHGALKIAGPEEDGTGQGGEGERSGLPATRTKAGERLNIRDQSTPGEGRSGLDDIEGRSVLKHQLQGNDDLHDQAGTDQRKQQLDHRLYAEGRPGLQGSGQVRPSADEHLLPTSDKAAQYLGPVSEEGGLDTDRSDNMGGQLSKRLQRGMQGVDQYGEPTMDEGASEQGKLKQYGQSPSGDERPNRYGLIDKDISGVRVDQYGRPVADDVEDDDQRKYAQGEPSMYDKKGSRKLEDALRSPLGKDKSWKEQLEQPRGPLTSEQDVRQASGVITGRGLKQLAFDLHGRPIDELHPDYGRLPSDKNSKACQAGVSVTRLLRDHDYKVYGRPMGTDFLIDDGKIEGIAATVKQGASLMEADKSDATGAQGKSAESITSKEPSKEPSDADEVHPSKRPSILDELDSMMAKANAALSSAEKRLSELQTDEQEPSPDDSTEQQHPRDDECEFYKGKTPGDQDLSRPPNETTGAAGKGVPPRSTTKEKRFSGQQVEPLSEFAEGKEGRRQGETDSKGGARDIANADLASPIAGDIATDREPYTPSSPADVASSGAGESETDDSMIGTPPDAVGKDHDYRKGGDNARTPTSPLSSTNAGGKQIGTHGAMGAGPPYRSKHEYVGAISPKEESPNDKRTPSPGVVQVLDASLAASGDRTTERSDREVIRGDQAGEDEPLLEKKSSPKETSPADQVDAATTGASPLAGSPVDDAAQKAAEESAKKKAAEELAAKISAEDTAQKPVEAEPAKLTGKAAKKAAKEAAKKKEAEEKAARKAAEEARKKKDAEEKAAKKAAEEEAKKKAAEEKAAKKAAEAAAKKAAQEEAKAEEEAKKAAEEAAKKAEEEAARKAAEEAAKKKADEEAAQKAAEEAAKKKAEEQKEAKKRAAEDAARKKAEEEAARKAEQEAAEEAAKKAANAVKEQETEPSAKKALEELVAKKTAEEEKAADANGVPDEVASQNPLQAEEKELKSFYREAGNNVQPIPWMEDFKVDLDDVNMDLSIENQPRIRTPDAGKTIHIDEIFDPLTNIRGKKGEPPKRILIRGQPGIGKSTLCRKLAYDWSNPENETGTIKKFKYTFLIEGRHLGGDLKNAMAEQLLSQGFNDTPENLWKFVEDNQNDVLFIVDGYDEIDSSVKSDVGDLISKKILPQSTLVLTSRPESTKEISRSVDKQLKVEGFNQEKSADFVNKHFHVTSPNTEHAPDVTENLVAALRRDKNLQQLAAYPLCNAYLCALWEDTDGDVPATKSSLYDRLKIVVTRRYCLKQGVPLPAKSSDVPVQFRSHYRALGELAYNGVTNNKVLFDKPLVLHKVRDPRVLQMGLLLEEHSIARTKRHEYYRFPHKAFQEFFAAQHLSEMSAYVRSPTYPKLVKDRVWRDIVLFLPGALKQQPRDLIPLFKALSEYNTTRKSTYSDVGQYRLSLDTLFEAELQDQYSTIVAPSLPSLLTESHPIIEGVSSPTLQGLACVLKQNNIDVKEFRFGVWTEKYDQNCDTLTEALNDNQTVGKLVIAACNENDVVESVKDILARLAERNNTVKSLQIIDYSYKGPLKYDERIEMLRKVCTIEEIKIDSAARVWYPGLPQNPSEAQHTIRSTPMTPMSTD